MAQQTITWDKMRVAVPGTLLLAAAVTLTAAVWPLAKGDLKREIREDLEPTFEKRLANYLTVERFTEWQLQQLQRSNDAKERAAERMDGARRRL